MEFQNFLSFFYLFLFVIFGYGDIFSSNTTPEDRFVIKDRFIKEYFIMHYIYICASVVSGENLIFLSIVTQNLGVFI